MADTFDGSLRAYLDLSVTPGGGFTRQRAANFSDFRSLPGRDFVMALLHVINIFEVHLFDVFDRFPICWGLGQTIPSGITPLILQTGRIFGNGAIFGPWTQWGRLLTAVNFVERRKRSNLAGNY
jgi:hypothetical protein